MTTEAKPGIRWWPVWIIGALAGAAFAKLWLDAELMRQLKVMGSFAVIVLASLLLVVWTLLLSRLPWRTRFAALGVALLLFVVLVATVRVRGMTGDWIPVLAWSWSEEAELSDDVRSFGSAASAPSEADNFPQFIGPSRNSRIAGIELARDFVANPPELLWKRDVGAAWTGFVVSDGLAVTMEQRGDKETIVAYELATGESVWSHGVPARFDFNVWVGGLGPRSSPTIDQGVVFAYGATGILTALDLRDGSLRWSRNVVEENAGEVPEWGSACSPLVYNGLVIVTAGGKDGNALIAYDRESGEQRWSGGSDRNSYSSPFVAQIGEREQIVVLNRDSLVGHDPLDGSVLWTQAWPSEQNPTVVQPLPIGTHRFLVSAGYGVGAKLFEITEANGTFASATLWESISLKAKFSQMVEYRGTVYGLDDGILVAIDPASGERHWKGGRYGHGQLLLVGDLLLVTTENGDVVLVEPNPDELRELSRFEALPGKLWNPPALAGPYLLLRNDSEAVCYKLASAVV